MTLKQANDIIAAHNKPRGYAVHFEWIKDAILEGDYFPNIRAGELPIQDEEEAWELAYKFAVATQGKTCNVYVIKEDFTPVQYYKTRMLNRRGE